MASRPCQSLSSAVSPISRSFQSILLHSHHTDTCLSLLLASPSACCCEKRRTSSSPVPAVPQHTRHSPHQEQARRGRQSGEPRELLSHTSSTEPAGSPWMRVDGKDTDSWGPAFPVTALSALSWAKVRVPVLVGTALPPPPSPAQRAGSAQAPLCKTSRS